MYIVIATDREADLLSLFRHACSLLSAYLICSGQWCVSLHSYRCALNVKRSLFIWCYRERSQQWVWCKPSHGLFCTICYWSLNWPPNSAPFISWPSFGSMVVAVAVSRLFLRMNESRNPTYMPYYSCSTQAGRDSFLSDSTELQCRKVKTPIIDDWADFFSTTFLSLLYFTLALLYTSNFSDVSFWHLCHRDFFYLFAHIHDPEPDIMYH